ncbi:portal protein [Asaia sp. BMEF1]|uniref:portal protein n=1 Tax=Asaia sp. BMEF1 TaxID=3155932 RepID=UPI003F661184
MDWLALQRCYATPPGASARTRRLLALQKVLEGAQYDALPYPFASERSAAGEYIPLSQRRPSVRTNLCRTVVDEVVSLLFGNTHWPLAVASHAPTSEAMNAFALETGLPAFMMQVATRGSVGSVAIWVEILDHRPRLSFLETAYLIPEWDSCGVLLGVTERFMVTGAELEASGYAMAPDSRSSRFWWQRRWTRTALEVFAPLPVEEEGSSILDEERSRAHDFGFVPVVWIRNLGAASGAEPDGECSFEKAIDTVIEADYLLSQAGRGLKYGSDPTLVLKTPDILDGVARQGGAASALTLPPEGDAKLLEINGAAAGAVLAHYRELRQLVLEQLHGNRTHGDRLGSPQSARAMELMCQPLIWMADRLRGTYGDGGLLPLYRMLCRLSAIVPAGLSIGGEIRRDLDPAGLSLHWPAWFTADEAELLPMAQGLKEAVSAGLLSQETAARLYACAAGIADPAAEWTKIMAAQAA